MQRTHVKLNSQHCNGHRNRAIIRKLVHEYTGSLTHVTQSHGEEISVRYIFSLDLLQCTLSRGFIKPSTRSTLISISLTPFSYLLNVFQRRTQIRTHRNRRCPQSFSTNQPSHLSTPFILKHPYANETSAVGTPSKTFFRKYV